MKFLEVRIGDKRVWRLIWRILKSGVMEDGLVRASEEGTPQGGNLSSLLSNVYLHYVLDLWFEGRFQPSCRGEAYLFRFADDFLVCFQDKSEAQRFLKELKERLEKFDLELSAYQDETGGLWTFCTRTSPARGQEARDVRFSGLHPLLWDHPRVVLQGQTPDVTQEVPR